MSSLYAFYGLEVAILPTAKQLPPQRRQPLVRYTRQDPQSPVNVPEVCERQTWQPQSDLIHDVKGKICSQRRTRRILLSKVAEATIPARK